MKSYVSRRPFVSRLLATALTCAAAATPALAQFQESQLYGFRRGADEVFRATTTAPTAAYESLGVTSLPHARAIEFDPEGNLLWCAFQAHNGVGFAVLNTDTGGAWYRSTFLGLRDIGDIACSRYDGTPFPDWYLSSPDTDTGETTIFKGDVRSGNMSELAVIPGNLTCLALIRNSRVLAYRESPSELLQIDTETGSFIATPVDPQVGTISDLDFDPISGQLFGIMATPQGPRWFGRLDPGTGLVELLTNVTALGPNLRIAIRRGERKIDGVRLCDPGVTGSSGQPARLELRGSKRVDRNDVVLTATGLPVSTFGLFIASRESSAPVMPAASIGNLCLTGAIGRVSDDGQPFSTQGSGSFQHALDLRALAQPNGAATVMGTETWAFQTWFRDSMGGLATSNFSDAVQVVFAGDSRAPIFSRPSINFPWLSHMVTGDLDGDGKAELVGAGSSASDGGSNGSRGLYVLTLDAAASAGVTFAPGVDQIGIAVGLELADLDNDGDLDAVVATRSPAGLRTFLNDGAGQLVPSFDEEVCYRPTTVHVADLDGDGNQDIALGCTSARMKVLFGVGGGMFGTPKSLFFTENPADVVLVDLNGNGRREIVSLMAGDGELEIRTVTASQMIGAPVRVSVGSGGVALASMDQDLDGNTDVLVLRTSLGSARLLRGTGTGSFAQGVDIPLGNAPAAFHATDIDLDGRVDLLTTEPSNKSYQRWMNTSASTFALGAEEIMEYPTRGVTSGDMDGDGLEEVIVTGGNSYTTVLSGETIMNPIPPVRQPLAQSASSLVSGDFNSDGNIDLLAFGTSALPVLLYPGLGDGTFGAHQVIPEITNGGVWNVAADVDLDGDLDVLTKPTNGVNVQVSLNNGAGAFMRAPNVLQSSVSSPQAIVSDFTGDGLPDLVLGHSSQLDLFEGDGLGHFLPPQALALVNPFRAMDMGDVNADGIADIAVLTARPVATNSERAYVLLGSGSGLMPATLAAFVDEQNDEITDLRLIDFDLDGLDDVVVYGDTTVNVFLDGLLVYLNNGDGSFAYRREFSFNARLDSFEFLDLDTDGHLDVVGVALPAALVVVAANGTGYSFFAEWHPTKSGPAPAYGDFDGDGLPDAVVASTAAMTLTTFLNVSDD